MGDPVKYGEYVLSERISVGGMAEVFRARHAGAAEGEDEFVIKKLLPQLAEDQRFVDLFAQEARLASQLEHPNIARVFEHGQVGGDHHIIMEYVPGPDLLAIQQRLRRRGEVMPVAMSAYIGRETAEALSHVHTHGTVNGSDFGLVHLDVTPPNVLLSYTGEVKLIDFGIAKPIRGDAEGGERGPKGKVAYMAPEVIDGVDRDIRSDLFSLGVMLHELLVGRPLFALKNDIVTMDRVRTARIRPPSKLNKDVPAEFDRVVLKALARSLDQRYATAETLRDDLEMALSGLTDQPNRDSIARFINRLFPFNDTSETPQPQWVSTGASSKPADETQKREETMPVPVVEPAGGSTTVKTQGDARDGAQATEFDAVDEGADEQMFGASITEAPSLSKIVIAPPRARPTLALDASSNERPAPSRAAPPAERSTLISALVMGLAALLGVFAYHVTQRPDGVGALVAVVQPANDLTFYLNDQALEQTQGPLVLQGLLPGDYELRVESVGFEPIQRMLAIQADTITTLDDIALKSTGVPPKPAKGTPSPTSGQSTTDTPTAPLPGK